jgi:uncharacterized protein (TIGR00297 family)
MNADEFTATTAPRAKPLFTTRKLVHIFMLGFAFLLPFLTWMEAAAAAILALLFNLYLLPQIDADLSKNPGASGSAQAAASGTPLSSNMWTGIIFYPISVLALILLYRHEMFVAAGAWAVMALGDGMASVAGEAWGGPRLPLNSRKTWTGLLAFVVCGGAGAYVLIRWVGVSVPPERAAWLAVLTAAVGAIVESLPIRLDDNLTVPLVSGAFLFCAAMYSRGALDSNLPYLGVRIALALAANALLALAALSLKLVTKPGAAVGALLGVAVYMGYGYKSFLLLLVFFVLGSGATRMGYAVKSARGIAERRRGARSWQEASANVLAAAFFSVLVITTHHERAFLLAVIAAFAEASGDTVSSEIGQWLSYRAYLVTDWSPVAAGENGGVSLAGSAAGILASALIAALGSMLGLATVGSAAVALLAAVAGIYVDSLLGATLERRGLLTKGTVNFTGTCVAGGLALAWALRVGY